MIFIDRNEAPPTSLTSAASLTQAQEAEAYYQTWAVGDPAFVAFTRYKEIDVQQAQI